MTGAAPDSTAVPAPADRCPRCGAAFHCGVDDAAPCPCTAVALSAARLAALAAAYRGCLCLRCLRELAAADAGAGGDPGALDAPDPAPLPGLSAAPATGTS